MTIDQAISELEQLSRQDLENWCKDAYEDIFATSPGKWLCKYSTEKLIFWFLMFYEWDNINQDWIMTSETEYFSKISD